MVLKIDIVVELPPSPKLQIRIVQRKPNLIWIVEMTNHAAVTTWLLSVSADEPSDDEIKAAKC
jgi:hypothetical protein